MSNKNVKKRKKITEEQRRKIQEEQRMKIKEKQRKKIEKFKHDLLSLAWHSIFNILVILSVGKVLFEICSIIISIYSFKKIILLIILFLISLYFYKDKIINKCESLYRKVSNYLESDKCIEHLREAVYGMFLIIIILTIKLVFINGITITELRKSDFMTVMITFITSISYLFENIDDFLKNPKFKKAPKIKKLFKKKLKVKLKILKDIITKRSIGQYYRLVYGTVFVSVSLIVMYMNMNINTVNILINFGQIDKSAINEYNMGNLINTLAIFWYAEFIRNIIKNIYEKQVKDK